MLQMVEKGEISHAIHRYAKTNNKYTKDSNKNKESSYFMYWDAKKVYERAMCQKVPVGNIE